ncbi:hypothetical protein [Kitasatospora sp. NPDC101183]|uniref:hypothetical protein n=1 Tax=Kitasatospora sp. NPDC101183 TaxID=3364100 RepID=UPI0038294C7C
MVGEEKRGGAGASGSAGFQLPAVNWALAAEEPEAEPANGPAAESAKGPVNGPAAGPAKEQEKSGSGKGGATAPVPPPAVPPVPEPEPEPESDPAAALAVPAPAAATPAAVAAAVVAEPDTAGESDPGPRPGRVSRPMIAAAVAVGLVLVGASVVVTRLGHDPKTGPARADNPPGYGQSDGGGNGFAPTFDEHGGTSGTSGDGGTPAPGQGGAPAPAPDGGTATPGDQAAAAPNAGVPAQPGQPARQGSGTGTGGTDSRSQGGSGTSGTSGTTGGGGTSGSSGGSTSGGGGTAGGAAPVQPAPQQPVPPAKPAPTVAFAGPYCSAKGTSQVNGWFDQGVSGWHKNSGGWSGDGCNGTYLSVPMSGAANKDDGNSVVWTFNLDNVTSCTLAVYIPASGDVKNVGGKPTFYTVSSGGSFNIDQTAYRGSWFNAGTFPYRGTLSVTLHTRGVDWGGNSYAHHAASAVRATCTP